MTLTITLKAARANYACKPAYSEMVKALGPGWKVSTPFPLLRVLEVRGLQDTLWALRCIPPEQEEERRRVTSLWLADVLERVVDRMQDERSRAILPLLREHAVNPVSPARWNAARAAAYAAYADAAYADAYAAYAYAAYAYAYAYADAADAADAARAAAYAYADAAYAYSAYAYATYADAASDREWQTERLRHYLAEAKEKTP